MPSWTNHIPGSCSGYHQQGSSPPQFGRGEFADASVATETKDNPHKTLKDSSGWRQPMPWFHTRLVTVQPTAEYVVTRVVPGAETVIDARTGDIDGAYNPNQWVGGQLPPVPSSLVDASVNRALGNLSNDQIGFGEDFGQRQETANMIGDRVTSIGRSVDKFSRSHPKDWGNVKKWQRGFRRTAAGIPKRWLELQYGWIPLLLDCKGAFDEMKRIDKDGPPETISVKGSRKDRQRYLVPNQIGFAAIYPGAWGDPYGFDVGVEVTDEIGCFVRLDYRMTNPVLASMQKLGVANPVALAWELVPYSFVVDWFLPIGQYLNSFTGALGLTFRGGSQTIFRSRKAKVVSHHLRVGGVSSGSGGLISPGHVDNYSVSRSVFDISPAPRLPSFKNPLSLGHFANAMSLLVSAFQR